MSPTAPQPPSQDSDHMSSLLAVSPPPISGKFSSPPFHGNLVLLTDKKAVRHQEHMRPNTVCISWPSSPAAQDLPLQPLSLPRAYKDDQGQKQQPGLRDLPNWLRESFRNSFIRLIIEQVCLSETPWNNPPLSLLQHEFNNAYPAHQIRLHSNDAAVVPVSLL